MRGRTELWTKEKSRAPLHTLTAFFQVVENREAFEILRAQGLPTLRLFVQDALEGVSVSENDILFVLKILGMYEQEQDVQLIAKAARKPFQVDDYMWSIIFSQFYDDHPYADLLINELRHPLPPAGFIRVTYLDLSNTIAINGKLKSHPFNTVEGKKQIEIFLLDQNKENFSYAHSATAALPFLDNDVRNPLFDMAEKHPDVSVRMEAAWARAKSGDFKGLTMLDVFSLDPRYSASAQKYLEELGHRELIPEKARSEDFQALAEMSEWLVHPNEFGAYPDEIEIFDSRVLYWPPTKDKRKLWLIKYAYKNWNEGKGEIVVGMVGSVTFALFGEDTENLSPEDIYGLHCLWELRQQTDDAEDVPTIERTAVAGREILAKSNPGFQLKSQ